LSSLRPVVIDSNLAVMVVADTTRSEAAERLIDRLGREGYQLLAPRLWRYEVTSTINKYRADKLIDRDRVPHLCLRKSSGRIECLSDAASERVPDADTQPRPAPRHAVAASNLLAELIGPYSRGKAGPGGWWIVIEPELHFVRDVEVMVPDVAGWRRTRMPSLPTDQRYEVYPDWICEVLSPSTRSKDREIKMPLYAKYGVTDAWVIDPVAGTLEAYQRSGSEWTQLGTYGAEVVVSAQPFEAARFRVGDLWT